MDDASFVCDFERLCDLTCDSDCFVRRNWTKRNAIGKCWTFDEFEHQSAKAVLFFEAVDSGNVWMIQRGENVSFALESTNPISVQQKRFGQDLDCHVTV